MAHTLFPRWRYSTRILFSGCDQGTYQQDVVVHRTWGTDYEEMSGGLKIWHVYVGDNCREDYGDVRFTNSTGAELAYYLWPDYTNSSARFCVRLENATAAGTLVVHYGNTTATTTSSGKDTYLLFDHFEGTSIDTEIWQNTATGGTIAVTGSVLTISGDLGVNKGLQSRASFGPGTTFETSFKGTTETNGYLLVSYGLFRSGNYFSLADSSTSDNVVRFYAATPESFGIAITMSTLFEALTLSRPATSSQRGSYRSTTSTFSKNIPDDLPIVIGMTAAANAATYSFDYALVRAYSATPPSLLGSARGLNSAYFGLQVSPLDDVIRFSGVGSIQLRGEEVHLLGGTGAFSIETRVSSSTQVTGIAELTEELNLSGQLIEPTGVGSAAVAPAQFHTPIVVETGTGLCYAAPTPVQFDIWKYKFKSLTISRSAQDALWQCEGRIVGLDAPLAYKQFEVKVPDHNGVLRTLFVGFVPGRDYARAVTANESIVQGYDAGFYLARQYLPDGDLTYPRVFAWGPMSLVRYFLGEETTTVGSQSRWEQVTGIMPYRLENPPSYYEWPYSSRIDWVFQPMTTKAQAIREICEKSGLVFLIKQKKINGVWTPCAYLIPEEDIDHSSRGLDLPDPVTFTYPDPYVMDGVRVTMRSDEKYNRIIVRSASPNGAWFEAIRSTPALQLGDELPIEYLEERSDLPVDADHYGWCTTRANELYNYYTQYSNTYNLTLINRVDLELYQRCRFYGFDVIPEGEWMRIVAIAYHILPTHSEVEITVTPDSRLSDLRKLQRSQAADAISEIQVIAQSQINQVAMGEVGTVVGVEGNEAIVEMERQTDSSIRGRIV